MCGSERGFLKSAFNPDLDALKSVCQFVSLSVFVVLMIFFLDKIRFLAVVRAKYCSEKLMH